MSRGSLRRRVGGAAGIREPLQVQETRPPVPRTTDAQHNDSRRPASAVDAALGGAVCGSSIVWWSSTHHSAEFQGSAAPAVPGAAAVSRDGAFAGSGASDFWEAEASADAGEPFPSGRRRPQTPWRRISRRPRRPQPPARRRCRGLKRPRPRGEASVSQDGAIACSAVSDFKGAEVPVVPGAADFSGLEALTDWGAADFSRAEALDDSQAAEFIPADALADSRAAEFSRDGVRRSQGGGITMGCRVCRLQRGICFRG